MVTPTTFSVASPKPYGQTMTRARMYVNATCDKKIRCGYNVAYRCRIENLAIIVPVGVFIQRNGTMEWNDGMEWNGMTTPTQRTLTTDTYCVCHLQPRSSSSIKENGLNQIQQPEGDLII